jgi:hypothetical protein
MRVEDKIARIYYLKDAAEQNWSVSVAPLFSAIKLEFSMLNLILD